MSNAATRTSQTQRERLARAHEILSASDVGRLRAQTLGEIAGWRHVPVWELDSLVERGLAVKLPATEGVCQATYATTRRARAEGWA